MPRGVIKFDEFTLDCNRYELLRGGDRIKLEKLPMELLILLVEKDGHLVTRQEIVERLWGPGVFLDTEHGINTAIRKIRNALRDNPEQSRFVQTVTGKGYRFIAATSTLSAGSGNGNGAVAASVNTAQAEPGLRIPSQEISAASTARRSRPLSRFSRRLQIASLLLLAVIAAAAVAIGLNLGGLRNRLITRKPPSRIHSLAVLPLENLSGDPTQDYFADGMTDEVITMLAKNSGLRVISRTSAMRYKKAHRALPDIARELGVDGILEGSVGRSGGRVHVNVQLIHAPSDTHVWAESYDRDLSDVLALQSDIGHAIADQIHLRLGTEGSGKLGKAFHVDPAAYEVYLKGRYFWNRYTVEGAKKSIEYFQEATAKDPGFAQAYAGLAAGYGILAAFCYLPSREAYPPSKAAAKKALEIDEMQSEAHTQLGFVNMFYEHDWPGTETEFRRAIELNPSNATAHDGLATYFLIQGKFDDALAEMERAKQLDPVSLNIKADRGWYLFFARRPDQAIAELQTTLELDPSFGVAHSDLGHAYEQQAMYGQAIREFQTAVAASSSHTCRLGTLGHAYAVAGQRDAANQVLEQLQQISLHRYVSPYHTALIYAGLGDQDQALSFLEKAYDERFWMITFLGVDPRLDGMRSAPRFQKLMRRLAFPPPS